MRRWGASAASGRRPGWPPTWATCTGPWSFCRTRRSCKRAPGAWSLWVSRTFRGDHPENAEGGGRVARYAWGRDYHEVIKERLFRLRGELEKEMGVRIKARGVHGRRAATGTLRGPARGARVLRAELVLDKQRDRVLLLHSRPDRGPRARARPAWNGHLRTLHPLYGPLPDRRHKGPGRGGRPPLHLLPDHREQG